MMDDPRHALLESILVQPDADEPRLAYADALEEDGDAEHAEFIRMQVAIARAEAEAPLDGATARVAALQKKSGERFAGAIAAIAEEWTFERGLVAGITVDFLTLANNAHQLLGSAPVEKIILSDHDEETLHAARSLAGCEHLARIRVIDASEGAVGNSSWESSGERWRTLLASDHLAKLETLIVGVESCAAVAEAIADAHERLPSLRELYFSAPSEAGSVFDRGALALAASPLCARLEVLEIVASAVGPRGVAALAQSFERIRSLSLPGTWYRQNLIGVDGARALASAKGLSNLEDLCLVGAGVGDEGLEALASAPWIQNLRRLDLTDNGLTERGLFALARSQAVLLERLDLHSGEVHPLQTNHISEAAVGALAELPCLIEVCVDDGKTWKWKRLGR